MIVVADTSPVNYLALIDEINILPQMFGRVLVPEAVFQELQSPHLSPFGGTHWFQPRSYQRRSAGPSERADQERSLCLPLAVNRGEVSPHGAGGSVMRMWTSMPS